MIGILGLVGIYSGVQSLRLSRHEGGAWAGLLACSGSFAITMGVLYVAVGLP